MTGRTPDFLRLARGPAGFHGKVRWVTVLACAIALLALLPPLSSARTGSGDPAGATGTGSVPVHALTATPCSLGTTCAAGSLVRGDLSRLTSAGFLANRTMGWSEVTPPPPTLGVGSGMIADTSTGTALLFGGESSGRLVNTTFAYTEATDGWTTIPTTNAPGPRSDFAFAFDPTDSTGILFGGLTNLTSLAVSNETWSYDVTTAQWTSRTLGPAPPAREAAAFAISPSLGIAFLYGGWNRNYTGTESITYSDLWELNLTTFAWTEVTVPGLRPAPLEDAAMLWDPTTARFEMFGGCYPCTSEVWQFNPTTLGWTDLGTFPGGPAARAGASWGYDPTDQDDLLFGGANGGVSYNDTYVFDAVSDTWVAQTLAPRPTARSDSATGFLDVPGNETWLLEGGVAGSVTYSDLWRLSATSNVSVQVLNATSLRPLARAQVNLSGRTAGFTNASGNLTLTQVNAVNQALDISEFRFFTRNTTIWLAPGRTTNLTVDLTTEPSGSVFVTVLQPSGTPFVNASVNLTVNGTRINLVPVLTNGTGNASFFGVPPGHVNVTVSAPFERPNYQAGVLVASGDFNATIGLVPEPVVSVTVLGRFPGAPPVPLNLAYVLLGGNEIGFTDSLGELTVPTAAYGLSDIVGEATGYLPASTIVDIPWTGSVEATLILDSLPFGTIAVSVLTLGTDRAIPGAYVTASSIFPLPAGPYGTSNFTNQFGTAMMALPEGSYSVSVSASGYLPSNSTSVFVLAGQLSSVTFSLELIPPATVHVLVRSAETGGPIPAANVSFGNGVNGQTNASGEFNATLPPATYIILVIATGYVPNATTVTLVSHENRTVVVNLTLSPLVVTLGGWPFALFPSGLGDLWPFLALPALLVVGAFVYVSVLRTRVEEEQVEPPKISGPPTDGSGTPTDTASGPAPSELSLGSPPGA
ncbi:MAG: carboxypeptidase regulatory-like domain-containing protein [Thermoplasmata archaeon]